MSLSTYSAELRKRIYAALESGQPPPEGEYAEDRFREGKAKGGKPQMGATRFEPHRILFEFIYPDPLGAPILLSVRVASPERIVFMPVPPWVVSQVWEGEVLGGYHFESDARRMLREFEDSLEAEANAERFDEVTRIGRH